MVLSPAFSVNSIIRKVLVVDDDPDMRNLVTTTLQHTVGEGELYLIECLSAGFGSEALRVAAKAHPDLILLDIGLPDMSGLDVLHRLRRSPSRDLSRIPVLIISVRQDIATVEAAVGEGTTDYLLKPFNPEFLLTRVRKILDN